MIYMSVDHPPPNCFYKERNLRILHRDCWKVGKGRFQEGFRKVHRKDINTWCRIRVQEGSGRFQEGGPEGHLHMFLLFSVRLCFFTHFLVCVSCRVYVSFVYWLFSFLLCVLFSLRYLFYVLDVCSLICVFVCWRLGGLKHTKWNTKNTANTSKQIVLFFYFDQFTGRFQEGFRKHQEDVQVPA